MPDLIPSVEKSSTIFGATFKARWVHGRCDKVITSAKTFWSAARRLDANSLRTSSRAWQTLWVRRRSAPCSFWMRRENNSGLHKYKLLASNYIGSNHSSRGRRTKVGETTICNGLSAWNPQEKLVRKQVLLAERTHQALGKSTRATLAISTASWEAICNGNQTVRQSSGKGSEQSHRLSVKEKTLMLIFPETAFPQKHGWHSKGIGKGRGK